MCTARLINFVRMKSLFTTDEMFHHFKVTNVMSFDRFIHIRVTVNYNSFLPFSPGMCILERTYIVPTRTTAKGDGELTNMTMKHCAPQIHSRSQPVGFGDKLGGCKFHQSNRRI